MSAAQAGVAPSQHRLALGTVQFGLNYGVANQAGQVSLDDVGRILTLARENGVDTIDTAMDYGSSETSLGQAGVQDCAVVTKLSALPDDVADVQSWVQNKVQGSLDRLGVTRLHGLLLHRPHQLWGRHGPALAQALQQVKCDGLVRKIGVSIYASDELDGATEALPIDLVQLPFNLIDRRVLTSGWLHKLHAAGVEVHVRSVFLQGLLLMPREAIPPKFERWSPLWDVWHEWLRAHEVTAVQACIAFVRQFPEVSRLVVGVDSFQQFAQLLEAAQGLAPLSWPDIAVDDLNLINPSQWSGL